MAPVRGWLPLYNSAVLVTPPPQRPSRPASAGRCQCPCLQMCLCLCPVSFLVPVSPSLVSVQLLLSAAYPSLAFRAPWHRSRPQYPYANSGPDATDARVESTVTGLCGDSGEQRS
jgi:hypothetical protein